MNRFAPSSQARLARSGPRLITLQRAFDGGRDRSVEAKGSRALPSAAFDHQRLLDDSTPTSLSHEQINVDRRRAQLVPGMTVQADITTGNKTILQYLLKPIYSAMAASFHER